MQGLEFELVRAAIKPRSIGPPRWGRYEWGNGLCRNCHVEFIKSAPFLCDDGVWRSIEDAPDSIFHDFFGVRFTNGALKGGQHLIDLEEEKDKKSRNNNSRVSGGRTTIEVETLGERLRAPKGINPITAYEFSEAVCLWGKDVWVWPKLREQPDIGKKLGEWLDKVLRCSLDFEDAIRMGIEIKGLQTSYASKHLRMLDPEQFAVLDSRFQTALGIAMNPKGYAMFMRRLHELKTPTASKNVATLEMQLFAIVRQEARAPFNP
jgi:hypothetical protein